MDGLEELMAQVATAEAKKRGERAAANTTKGTAATPTRHLAEERSPNSCTSPREAECDCASLSAERATQLVGWLERLRLDLADPDVREALEAALSTKAPKAALTYYLDRPALAQYTIDTELPRMAYRVVPFTGAGVANGRDAALTSAADIAALFQDDASRRRAGEDRGPEVLWRMANQSLFADAFEAVHRLIVVPHDKGGVLCLAAATEQAQFFLDLPARRLSAKCGLSLGTLKNKEGGRLLLATVKLSVDVAVSADGLRCLEFRQVIEALLPEVVFGEQLAAAAKALAELNPEDGSAQPPPKPTQEWDGPGFVSVRAATAIGEATASALGAAGAAGAAVGGAVGEATASALGAAATASASALSVAARGLFALSWGGAAADAPAEALAAQASGAAGTPARASAEGEAADAAEAHEFDEIFAELERSTSGVSPPVGPDGNRGVVSQACPAAEVREEDQIKGLLDRLTR